MKAKELFAGTDIEYAFADMEFAGVTSDSRRVREGYLFICQKGYRHDGHYHSSEAVGNGALAVLSDHPIDKIPPHKIALTRDTRTAESMVWNNFWGRPADGMTKVAITGTAGKTSVAFILRHILASAGHKVGIITTVCTMAGNVVLNAAENGGSSVSDIHGAMTTPDPEYFFGKAAQMREYGCDTLIYEASSQSLLFKKTSAISPDIAIFTNLSPEHLDCHGDMESYFAVKATLLESAKTAIINVDDEWMSRLVGRRGEREIIRCSADYSKVAKTEVCALRYASHGTDGSEFVYFSESAVFRIKTPLVGKYSMYNVLEAAACAIRLGVDPMTVKESLSTFGGVDGRLKRIEADGINVFIDYAHTPEAVRNVGETVKSLSKGKLIILFGCGGDRDRTKRPAMAKAAQSVADYVIITGDNPRNEDPGRIIKDILSGIDDTKPFAVIPDRRVAVQKAVAEAKEGDVVLLLGKGHEKYEILSDGKHPFDEEKLVRDALKARGLEPKD